ncbi:hypothetical protein B9N43_13045 [Denitratisoma sp. DHT3]|uniref:lysophospholipid acyltransferase family protein n=1 Tax=Denitratisoma sp. DHT3 TaxID=1981880 RepID=UPI0011989BE6|nr:lysophospholipid acyltransferase family protein [Denitratisoma sp. DHT3]QDX82091.1 hypothetical protein B9N43_13045 [Denitratisoma sp. DHT3]
MRVLIRLPGAALYLLGGALVVLLFFRHWSEARRQRVTQAWSRGLLRILGIRARYRGQPPMAGLVVANHISFVDIFALNGAMPACFVSKAEVARWPLIGWLCRRTDTLFLERGSRAAAQRARENLVRHLAAGKRVVVFPEGTTSRGEAVLPFHSALLQSAIDAGTPVTPVVLRYLDRAGRRSEAPAYVGDVSLLQCLRTIAASRGLVVEVEVLPAHAVAGGDRRHVAAHLHRSIAHRLHAAGGPAPRTDPPSTGFTSDS